MGDSVGETLELGVLRLELADHLEVAAGLLGGGEGVDAGELGLLIELQRKGMQVVIPDAESFRTKAKPAVDELFRTQWAVTTWAEVLAQ